MNTLQEKAFTKRKEYLFLYSVRHANPNGDPLNANHPRMDEETGRILVSDVRVKRTVRDEWLRQELPVFVDGEPRTLAARVDDLKKSFGVESGKDALARCIDARLFGATFADNRKKESFSWTGPVQFSWGRSLHRVRPELVQGTAAFAAQEGKEQRSFRNEYLVPFALIGLYGVANQYAAAATGASEEDLHYLSQALWDGTAGLYTRSKMGHLPRLLLEVSWKEGFRGAAGFLDDLVFLEDPHGKPLEENREQALRSCKDFRLNLTPLAERLNSLGDHLEDLRLRLCPDLKVAGIDAFAPSVERVLNVVKG